MKKSYNPFKLWGSYIGALVGILSAFSFRWSYEIMKESCGYFCTVNIFTIVVPIGFIAGYGIHILVREIKDGK